MSQGHIRAQSDGSWEIKFDLGRDPLSGRRITKYVTFRGIKRKAQEELTRLLGQRNVGAYFQVVFAMDGPRQTDGADGDLPEQFLKTARNRRCCQRRPPAKSARA
jgi:hypothetical protein